LPTPRFLGRTYSREPFHLRIISQQRLIATLDFLKNYTKVVCHMRENWQFNR
jgi:hypothetical protein